MRIDAPSKEDILQVALEMRPHDAEEFLAGSDAENLDELALRLADAYAGREDTFGFYIGKHPVAIGGMLLHRPNVATMLFFATPAMHKIAVPLVRFVKQRLFPTYREAGVHRIECVSLSSHTEAHRWIEMLGMKRGARMEGFGRNGEAFFQFAWVDENVCSISA